MQGRIGCLDGEVVHLYHGTRENRRYQSRYRYLADHGFDPATDIERDESGLLRWTDRALREKPTMVRQVAGYFLERREDD